MPTKKLPEFKRDNFLDNRKEVATGNGVMFKKELRIHFASLQEYKETDGAYVGDMVHIVFDEAMPSDKRLLTDPLEDER
jgi:hypothetical protein